MCAAHVQYDVFFFFSLIATRIPFARTPFIDSPNFILELSVSMGMLCSMLDGTMRKALRICAANTIFASLFSKLMNVFRPCVWLSLRRSASICIIDFLCLFRLFSHYFFICFLSHWLCAIWFVFLAVKIRSSSCIIWHWAHRDELPESYIMSGLRRRYAGYRIIIVYIDSTSEPK